MDPIETLKSLGKAALSIKGLEERAQILALVNQAQTEVFELRQQTFTMQGEIDKLRRTLAEQQQAGQLLAAVEHRRNVYWKDEKPCCVACAHNKNQLIPLARHGTDSTSAYCPSCKMSYPNVYGDDPPPEAPFLVSDEMDPYE